MGYKQEGKFSRGKPRPSGGARPFNKPNKFELFDATCEKCGKSCQVPFKPTGNKPIYCRDCFNKNESPRSAPMNAQNDSSLDEINDKLDKIMRALKIN